MLAHLNLFILVTWLMIEAAPLLADKMADWEVDMRREDRKD